jgi:hypothetical protein
MKINYDWGIVVIVLIFLSLLVFTIDPHPDCYKECLKNKYSDGLCVSMSEDQNCEIKFNYTSFSRDLCSQRNPEGVYVACCCK